ncbi:MAG: glycosyltransferase family 10 [Xanthobacteraceae bacterium]|nr:glycosyltransferase family 10 [Xanthobacteraceae bacterium]
MSLILFYNWPDHANPSYLPVADQQAFTSDAGCFDQADAVVFHLPTLGRIESLRKPAGQLWVLWSMESVVNYPAMSDPSVLKVFDLVMTYQRAADVWTPYIPDHTTWENAVRRPVPRKTATAPAVMFQSSPFNRSGRIGYAAELMKAIRVDSYGHVLNTIKLPVADRGHVTKLATIGRYKFCLSFENSICDDYVTEKFFDPLLAGTVPVYLGARNVDAFAPADDCYIDVRDFAGPRQLADYLTFLDQNDAAYQRLHAWRGAPLRPSLAADLARRGSPFEMLLQAVVARRSRPATASDAPTMLSYDPARYGTLDPSRTSVAFYIYDRPAGSGRTGLSRLRALPRRVLRATRRWFGAPGKADPPRRKS